jgi:hypothetical protein
MIVRAGSALVLVIGIFSPSYSVIPTVKMSAANAASFNCVEYKTRLSNQSAKDAATDTPSWAKGEKPCKKPVSESGNDFAKRLMDEKYPGKIHDTGPTSEYSKIKKFGDRAFE